MDGGGVMWRTVPLFNLYSLYIGTIIYTVLPYKYCINTLLFQNNTFRQLHNIFKTNFLMVCLSWAAEVADCPLLPVSRRPEVVHHTLGVLVPRGQAPAWAPNPFGSLCVTSETARAHSFGQRNILRILLRIRTEAVLLREKSPFSSGSLNQLTTCVLKEQKCIFLSLRHGLNRNKKIEAIFLNLKWLPFWLDRRQKETHLKRNKVKGNKNEMRSETKL